MEASTFFQRAIDQHRSILRRDKVAFQSNYEKFINFAPLLIDQPQHEACTVGRNILEVSTSSTDTQANNREDRTRELMLTAEFNRRNGLTDFGRNLMPSQYGFPGLGEYDDKRQKYLQERKKDYLNYLNEQNSKPRFQSSANDKYLDYEGLLAQKRQLENDYRLLASDIYFTNGVMKPSKSENNVTDIQNYNSDRYMRDQNYDPRSNTEYINPRPRSYPAEINVGFHSNFATRRDGSDDFGKRSANNIHLFSYNIDQQSRRHPSVDSFSGNRWKTEEQRKSEYQVELGKQVEEDRLKRAKMKEEDERLNRKLEEENRNYDPYGRGGAGAPRRDRYGNVIASRRQVDNYENEKAMEKHTELPRINENERASNKEGKEANYTVHRSPPMARSSIPGPSIPMIRDERRVLDSYKDDLKRQIEDKKLKDQLEKEKERLEDEKLARRIQEQHDKMQREYEEEQKKHMQREEDRRRRNEDLQRKHEEQRKEASRRRKAIKDEKRHNNLETRERVSDKNRKADHLSNDLVARSPPVPSLKTKQGSELRRDSNSVVGPPNQRPQPPPSTSRSHILSQLSTMRQQLEREQQQIQEQLKKQNGGNDIFDQKLPDGHFQHADEYRNMERDNSIESSDKSSSVMHRPIPLNTKPDENAIRVSDKMSHVEHNLEPKAHHVRKLPTAAISLRSLDGFAPLQGDSLFLNVDDSTSAINPYHQQNAQIDQNSHLNYDFQNGRFNEETLADQEAARKRYLHTFNNDPDVVNADSFLDEYLARNIKK